jgi:zinc/manganese transport system permease protein
VAFPGALAAAAAGIDERAGLFAATVAMGAGIGVIGGRRLGGAAGGEHAAGPADDTTIGIVFTFILGLGVFFLTLFSRGSGGGAGIQAAHTLFGSIFGLTAGAALLAAGVALAVTLGTVLIARPLLFASVAPEVAAARGVPTRLLGVGFLVILGVVAAEASQVVGALLLLGLLAAPAGASQRLARSPFAGMGLSALMAVGAMWGGLVLSYAVPSLPPGSSIVAIAVVIYYAVRIIT